MHPVLNQALMQDFVHVQAFARTKHGSNFESNPYAGLCAGLNMDPILKEALTQDSVLVQPFVRTKHGSNFESGPYAGLCSCSALCQD